MNRKHMYVSVGVSLALALIMIVGVGGTAQAQIVPAASAPAPTVETYDATVPYVQCGPANMVPPSARPEEYKGCRKATAAVSADAPLPSGVSENILATRMRPDGTPELVMISGKSLVQQVGVEQARTYSEISEQVCKDLTKNDGWRDAWRILRPILKVGAVALAWQDFGATYGILSLVTIGAGEVDQQFHDEDRENWVKLAELSCRMSKDYDRKYGRSLRDTPPVPRGQAGATGYYD